MRRVPTSTRVFKLVGSRQDWKCAECEATLRSTAQVDHIHPLHAGGSNHPSNLQVLCVECHARKTQEEAAMRLRYSPYFTKG